MAKTVRGIVRDEHGRPVSKAWIGDHLRRRRFDQWQFIDSLPGLRERKEPYRDEQGNIVPPGPVGKYFELRDDEGQWMPVNPAEVRRYVEGGSPSPVLSPFDLDPSPATAAIARGQAVYMIRVKKSGWELSSLQHVGHRAERTDSAGRFLFDFTLSAESAKAIHFASPDFSQQAIHSASVDDL